MRDVRDETEIQRLLLACTSGDTQDLGSVLHPDFAAFGVEDGLYIRADQPTYIRFLQHSSTGEAPRPRIEWIDARNRMASGCVVQGDNLVKKIIVTTLLLGDKGWRVMTATFSGEEAGLVTTLPQARRQ